MEKLSPLMEQFFNIKEKYGDYILFFRVGDFYEMFYDDAITASKVLDLTLTGKNCGMEQRAPMCGVPYHSCDIYIGRLVSKGYKVAICEQVTDPATSKGLVDREVIREITPGTVSDTEMLTDDRNNYLCAIVDHNEYVTVCFADISTGDIYLTSFGEDTEANVCNEFCKYLPSEILISEETCKRYPTVKAYAKDKLNALITTMEPIEPTNAIETICKQFHVQNVEQLKLNERYDQIYCLFYLLYYIKTTQKCDISYLNSIEVYPTGQFMQLDISARRNLELVSTMRGNEKKGSLLYVLDKTKSAMGARMLRSFLERPLLSVEEIEKRQDAVESLNQEMITRSNIQIELDKIYDLERLITRVMYKTAKPKELISLKQTFELLPEIRKLLSGIGSSKIEKLFQSIDDLQDMYELLERAIDPDAPNIMRDGKYIRDGYNQLLDEYRLLLKDSSAVIRQMEQTERDRTGIKNLKIGYNKVFGYYIEVTKAYFDKIPEDYIRKQTLLDKERLITQPLKELENKIISAKDKAITLEQHLFAEILDKIAENYYRIRTTASALAELDVYCAFSQISFEQNLVRPVVNESDTLDIVDGRHPVVEYYLKDSFFVPNDAHLDRASHRVMIITGPNMGGKSTYMRQVAVITIMAQIGCFVPARSATIGIIDKIFTRVGASDDLAAGDSTFMVEMKEVADILSNATDRSLLVLDEIGRGTSTFDGMSIAQAVVEYLASGKNVKAKALFATHYHELCDMEEQYDSIFNCNVAVKKRGEQVLFLKKIVPGGADNSYGIEVAALAGIPKSVVNRAKEILKSVSVAKPEIKAVQHSEPDNQFSFTDMASVEIADELKNMDVSTLTPIEAISKLYELSNKAKSME